MWALLSIAPVYYTLRIFDIWSGRTAVDVASFLFGPDRAGSLEFRLMNEDLFIAKALQRPIFGWGGWGRGSLYEPGGRLLTIVDQIDDYRVRQQWSRGASCNVRDSSSAADTIPQTIFGMAMEAG